MDQTTIISLLILSATLTLLLILYVVNKSKSGRLINYFVMCESLIFLWTVFYIFEYLAPNFEIRWIIIRIEYFAICFIAPSFIAFAYVYTRQKLTTTRQMGYLMTPFILLYISVLTNDWHHLFYRVNTVNKTVFGPLCWILLFLTLCGFLIGNALFVFPPKNQPNKNRTRNTLFIISNLIPPAVHSLTVFNVVHAQFTYALLVMPISILLMIVSIMKYQFLDAIPYAINDVVETMEDGVLVLSEKSEIIDFNTKFFTFIPDFRKGMRFEEMLFKLRKNVDAQDLTHLENARNVQKNEVIEGEFTLRFKNQERKIRYAAKAIMDFYPRKMATLITFHDLTEISALYIDLEQKNEALKEANEEVKRHMNSIQQLAVEKERNRIMADIHDTLGHSMTELLALIEVGDMIIEKNVDIKEQIEAVEVALSRARAGLSEIRQAVSKYKKMGGII